MAGIATGIPLALDPGGYFIFLPLKWLLASVLVAAGIGVLILERRPLVRGTAFVAWMVLLGVFIASSIFGVGGLTSWIGYPGRYLGVLAWVVFFGAFLLGASTSDDRDRDMVILGASAASIIVSVYAILQAVGIDPIQWSQGVDLTRTRSTLGNAAFLGAYLAMIVPLTARLALSASRDWRTRAVHIGAAALGAVALVTTQARAAWLGAVAGLIVVGALEANRLRARPRRAAAAVAAGALLILVLATASPVGPRVRSIVDPTQGTARGRLLQWGRTVELIAARPVLGWGPETYAFTFPRFIDPTFEREVGREVVPDRAHNVFLDVASATGLLGVGAYVAVLALLAWAVIRARHRDPMVVALAGACVAYVVQLQFSFPLADVDVIFWLLGGLLLASTGAAGKPLPRGVAVVPLAAAVLFAGWGATDMAADRLLRHALTAEASGQPGDARRAVDQSAGLAFGRVQYLQAAERLHVRLGEGSGRSTDFTEALDVLEQAQGLVPRDLELALDRADLFLSWGETLQESQMIEQAAAGYREILSRDPNSSRAHLKLGVALVELNRKAAAENEWLTAASLAPTSASPLLNLGLLYEQEGRNAEARRTLQRALALDPSNQQARDALQRLGA